MVTIVLDSGAFIAAERQNPKLFEYLAQAARTGTAITAPATVLAEVWREPVNPRIARLLSDIDELAVLDDAAAKRVGRLLGKSRTAQIADADIATLAAALAPSIILTSEPDDIERLLASNGTSFARGFSKKHAASVRIDVL